MNYEQIKKSIQNMINENYEDFIKAMISIEKGINDNEALDTIYQDYMHNDTMQLLNDSFDELIDELRENGQIKDNEEIIKEADDLVNITGNLVKDVEFLERENKQGESFKVANFTVVSKDEEGNKIYTNCSAYGDKVDGVKNLKQGDFIKVFGQERKDVDDKGKEHTNVRVFSSKLLKAREHMKAKEEKPSILGQLKDLKDNEKEKHKENKMASKENEL